MPINKPSQRESYSPAFRQNTHEIPCLEGYTRYGS